MDDQRSILMKCPHINQWTIPYYNQWILEDKTLLVGDLAQYKGVVLFYPSSAGCS